MSEFRPILTQDQKAWEEGFNAGREGNTLPCPYTAGSREAWSWHSGQAEGKANRQG